MTDNFFTGSTGKLLIEFMQGLLPLYAGTSSMLALADDCQGQPWCAAGFSGLNLGEQSIILCVFVVMPLDPQTLWGLPPVLLLAQ